MMRNLEIKKQAFVSYTLDQWELYDTATAETISYLNYYLQTACNNFSNYREASTYMYQHLRNFSEHGACDSEPMWLAEKTLQEIYN